MITETQLTEIGRFNQPHGIKGEINAIIYDGVDLTALTCIILNIDGIFVPFFIGGARQRGAQSVLVTLDGIENEQQAAAIANKTIYALAEEVCMGDESAEDGFYAEDLIGYAISTDDGALDGVITDIDDSTENILFIVDAKDGRSHLIPVADELITDIDTDKRQVTVDLPDGLLDIGK